MRLHTRGAPRNPAVPAAAIDSPQRFALDTRALPPSIRFDAWRLFWHPAVMVTRPEGGGDFAGRAVLRRIGAHVLLDAEAEAAGYRRPRRQALRDGLEHWFIGLGFRPQAEEPHTLWLGALGDGLALRHVRGRWMGVFIAPERMPQLASVFAAPHTVPLGSPTARMLAGMLPRLAASVEEVSADEMPRLDAVLTAILSACLPGWELRPASTRAQLEAARRARVIALVDQMLGSPALTPALLVRRSGLSRSELYRCFTPAGGLARVIQMRRLRHAYAALARADGPGAINRVAETVGFPDPSNFTRAFRREFGCTPTEVVARRLPAAGVPPPGLVAALTAGPG